MNRQLIQMKLNENTINKVEELKLLLKEDNRTQLVAEGIAVYLELTKAIQDGSKVVLEKKDGTKERLILTR
jgi:hypothetical protein